MHRQTDITILAGTAPGNLLPGGVAFMVADIMTITLSLSAAHRTMTARGQIQRVKDACRISRGSPDPYHRSGFGRTVANIIKDADHGRSARDDACKLELYVMMNPGNYPGL